MNKQHNPKEELPPKDFEYQYLTRSYSIPVIILDKNGYCVARYDYDDEFWFVDDGYIPSKDNSGVDDIKAWWYCPEYKE